MLYGFVSVVSTPRNACVLPGSGLACALTWYWFVSNGCLKQY